MQYSYSAVQKSQAYYVFFIFSIKPLNTDLWNIKASKNALMDEQVLSLYSTGDLGKNQF